MKALSILLLGIFVLTGCASTQMSEADRALWQEGPTAAAAPAE